MTEWRRFALMREERDVALRKVAELEAEVEYLTGEYNRLEQDNLDLIAELADARLRHPSNRGT